MAGEWGTSPLGNLAQFEVPQFKTGEGLAAILALRQRQAEHAQDVGASIGESLGEAMAQRKKDAMYNSLMDQYSKEYNVANPFAGQGEQGFKAATQLIKLRQEAEKEGLAQRMGEARLSRLGSGGGGGGGGGRGGGGGTSGFETIWHNGIEYRKSATGRGWVPIKTEGGGAPGAAVKPRTQHQQDELYLDVESLRAEAEKQKAENIKKGLANVPFLRESELNPRAKLLGVDPVTGQPITAAAPKTELAPGYGVPTTTTTSTRAGAGPTDAAIAHLKQHPELATDFDSMYGSGMAAQYLGQ